MKGVISLRMDPSLLKEIDRVAKEEGKTRSALIKEAVRYYLQRIHSMDSSEGFVPFLEYKKVNEDLMRSLDRIRELEVEITSLRKENEFLKREVERKRRRWFF